MRSRSFVLSILMLATALPARSDTFHLTIGSAANALALNLGRIRSAGLTSARPAFIRRLPGGLSAPKYFILELGPAERRTVFTGVLDQPPGKEPRLYLDENRTGDLSKATPVAWTREPYAGLGGKVYTRLEGDATLQVPTGSSQLPTTLRFFLFDPSDPNASLYRDTISYVSDFSRVGSITLAGVQYPVCLYDMMARGDFRGNISADFSGTALLIDVNHDGQFEPQGEVYDVGKPFNIHGVTYQATVPNADGSTLVVTRSPKSVKEIPAPPVLTYGNLAPAFTDVIQSGAKVRFPQDYKGHRVLLYFWASWCPDCARQNPYMSAAYKKYHKDGLDILSVSLDRPDQASAVARFMRQHDMPWPNIYNGKFLATPEAQLYYIQGLPTPLLVDGGTGKILAGRTELLGPELDKTLNHWMKR